MIRYDYRKIRELRESNGLNQKQFADRLGVSRAAVCYWEKGSREPQLVLLGEMCNKFDVEPTYFFLNVD